MTARHATRPRRGNTIVLVTGILVMLVIVATAYVTRAQSGRRTAIAVNDAETRDTKASFIAQDLAGEVAGALFVQPVDETDPDLLTIGVASSNYPRLSPLRNAVRYGVDQDDDGPDGFPDSGDDDGLPDFPYNFASRVVFPWTNWPDQFTATSLWPFGPGAPNGAPVGDENPFGNPGFGDHRWLCSFEPTRISTGLFGFTSFQDGYSHWPHLSNIARPNNGWRIATDISDVFDVDGNGLGVLLGELTIPVEQWAVAPTPLINPTTATTVLPANIADRFAAWFSVSASPPYYPDIYTDPSLVPPNYLKLNDLDGNGIAHDFVLGGVPQDTPAAEFVPGTARWAISRFMADTDGDGFTDSFWFLVPSPVDKGIRQLVAVRIIDNASMLNVNTALQFQRNNNSGANRKTLGLVPTDLAMVGQNGTWSFGTQNNVANVGFLDNPAHDEFFQLFAAGQPLYGNVAQGWLTTAWTDHLFELGISNTPSIYPFNGANQLERLRFWQYGASRPLAASFGATPYAVGDEVELRLFNGQNQGWTLSRLEAALQEQHFDETGPQILRATIAREETSEYLDQLDVREMRYDLRSKMTCFNGVRNDELVPWLRWRWDPPAAVLALADPNGDDVIDNPAVLANFIRQSRTKLDLRERDPSTFDLRAGEGYLVDRLAPSLALALTDGPADLLVSPGTQWGSYFGGYSDADYATPGGNLDDTRRLAAGLAANILQFRDDDQLAPLEEAQPLPEIGGDAINAAGDPQAQAPRDPLRRMLGMEAQPFLLEAMIAHVYREETVPPTDFEGDPWQNAGDRVIYDNPATRSTLIAVQIANPYEVPIDLTQYTLSVFGQEVDLLAMLAATNSGGGPLFQPNQLVLPPSHDDNPSTAVFYAIEDDLGGDNLEREWIDFLDVRVPRAEVDGTALSWTNATVSALQPLNVGETYDLVTGSLVINVDNLPVLPGFSDWSTDRDDYDGNTNPAIELRRKDPLLPAVRVVVDRIDDPDDPRFAEAVDDLTPPPAVDPATVDSDPPIDWTHPGYTVAGAGEPGTWHWVQYVRAVRAWGVDVDANGSYDPDERNPRYVFGDMAVVTQTETTTINTNPNEGVWVPAGNSAGGVKFRFDLDPDDVDSAAAGIHPWFKRSYVGFDATPETPAASYLDTHARKPFFFDFNSNNGLFNFPDKGWYSQPDGPDDPLYDPSLGGDPALVDAPVDYLLRLKFPMQMLQKDGDFARVGEVLDVWTLGHELRFLETSPGVYALDVGAADGGTARTFSEFMTDEDLVGDDRRVNRLRAQTAAGTAPIGTVLGVGDPASPLDPRHAVPALPAAARVLDLFVCDGPGRQGTAGSDELLLAQQYAGEATPGMINVNGAPIEVLQSLPHAYKLAHEVASPNTMPRAALAEAIVQYRERYDGGFGVTPISLPGIVGGPNYFDRTQGNVNLAGLRGSRGIASIGELLLLTAVPQAPVNEPTGTTLDDTINGNSWSVDTAADPWFQTAGIHETMRLSTDLQGVDDGSGTGTFEPDDVAGDSEEANLLFSGLSNLVTTGSDMFTVWFRVRSFRRNPETGVWNALDPEQIVDDSRYVMLVDRSHVNRPGDAPRILYLEKQGQ